MMKTRKNESLNTKKRQPDPWQAVEDKYAQEEAFSPKDVKGSGVINRRALLEHAHIAVTKTGIVKPYFQNLAAATSLIAHDMGPAISHHFFTKAAGIEPKKAIIYRLRGLSAIRIGEIDQAYDLFEKAKTLQPKDPRASYYIARILEMNGLNKEALFSAYEAKDKCGKNEEHFKVKVSRYIADLKRQTGISQPVPLEL
jgi:tetratricopeptide (TPR) repeat protein